MADGELKPPVGGIEGAMPRTTSNLVIGVLGADYGALPDGTMPDLTGYIASANVITNRVQAGALKKNITLGDDELELIERWLAAHFYACSDKPQSSRSTQGASASFQGQTGQGFEATLYGQTAMRIDYSNLLRNIDKQQRASVVWLGKPPSAQIPIDQRD